MNRRDPGLVKSPSKADLKYKEFKFALKKTTSGFIFVQKCIWFQIYNLDQISQFGPQFCRIVLDTQNMFYTWSHPQCHCKIPNYKPSNCKICFTHQWLIPKQNLGFFYRKKTKPNILKSLLFRDMTANMFIYCFEKFVSIWPASFLHQRPKSGVYCTTNLGCKCKRTYIYPYSRVQMAIRSCSAINKVSPYKIQLGHRTG